MTSMRRSSAVLLIVLTACGGSTGPRSPLAGSWCADLFASGYVDLVLRDVLGGPSVWGTAEVWEGHAVTPPVNGRVTGEFISDDEIELVFARFGSFGEQVFRGELSVLPGPEDEIPDDLLVGVLELRSPTVVRDEHLVFRRIRVGPNPCDR